jgi:hypothetical protein
MSLVFGMILGGMTMLIGTSFNLIVLGFRNSVVGSLFMMFDFVFVGLVVVVICIVFIVLFGWWLVSC